MPSNKGLNKNNTNISTSVTVPAPSLSTSSSTEPSKKSRGKKSAVDHSNKEMSGIVPANEPVSTAIPASVEEHKPKKRGRKPKGGKVVIVSDDDDTKNKPIKLPNVILHLKCHTEDIDEYSMINIPSNVFEYNPHIENVMPFNHGDMEGSNLMFSEIAPINRRHMEDAKMSDPLSTRLENETHGFAGVSGSGENNHIEMSIIGNKSSAFGNLPSYNPMDIFVSDRPPGMNLLSSAPIPASAYSHPYNYPTTSNTIPSSSDAEGIRNKNQNISEKLSTLREIFHHNQAHQKRSNCFWCTQAFDGQPIYLPKHKVDHIYEVYGCFCTPQCAAAYLMNERISTSTLWERYALLNSLYCGIYGYEKGIQPAPSPHYLLDCYHGNLTIDEYRHMLLQNESVMIIDKPMARLMPELYDTNTDVPGNARIRVAAKTAQTSDYALKRKTPRKTGKEMYQEQWGSMGGTGIVGITNVSGASNLK